MPKETKVTVAELEVRNNAVMELLCEGKTTKSIYKYGQENGWDVSTRQIDNYISTCFEQIHKEVKANKKYILDSTIKKRYTLYEKAYEAEDYRLCKDILNDLNKLLGHFAPDTIVNNFTQYNNQYNQFNGSDTSRKELDNKFGSILSKVGTDE